MLSDHGAKKGVMNYSEYMASTEWRTKRKARLDIDGGRCRMCDHDGRTFHLEVHHRPSSYKHIPNESIERDLTTLCKRCHDLITAAIRKDRYGSRQHEVVFIEATEAREKIDYGLATENVSPDWVSPIIDAQRPAGVTAEQVVAPDEGDFIEARQNGR